MCILLSSNHGFGQKRVISFIFSAISFFKDRGQISITPITSQRKADMEELLTLEWKDGRARKSKDYKRN